MTDIFSTSPQQENKEVSPEDKVAQQLASIKREDGSQMFDTVDKALESLAHAQQHIPTLKSELSAKDAEIAALKEQVSKAAAIDDVIKRLAPQQAAPEPEANPEGQQVSNVDIGELVRKEIGAQQAEATKVSNREQANQAMIAKFGDADKAALALQEKAKELGVGVDFLTSMADNSPKALLAYFNAAPAATPTPTTNSVNIRAGHEPQQVEVPELSLRKANTREQVDHMQKIKQAVYQQYGVVT